jgi:serine/threonine protein kinase
MAAFTITGVLPTGSDSRHRVYSCRDQRGQTRVVKLIPRDRVNLAETNVMASYHHPHLNHALSITIYGSYVAILQETAVGSLANVTLSAKKLLATQHAILGALHFLHQRGIAHVDVKPANMLRYADGLVRLADFGSSRHFDLASGLFLNQVSIAAPELEMRSISDEAMGASAPMPSGRDSPHSVRLATTEGYRAPECDRGVGVGCLIDIWAAGCSFLELATTRRPRQPTVARESQRPEGARRTSTASTLTKSMLVAVEVRPSAQTLLESFFADGEPAPSPPLWDTRLRGHLYGLARASDDDIEYASRLGFSLEAKLS